MATGSAWSQGGLVYVHRRFMATQRQETGLSVLPKTALRMLTESSRYNR
jgi:hypothetical protein